MLDFETGKKAWALLDGRERRAAGLVLIIVLLGAVASALMIGSVMPFLTVLARPQHIHENATLEWAYKEGGFTSDYSFLIALGLVSLGVIVAANLVQMLRDWAMISFTTNRQYTLSRRLMVAYLRQPYEFFLNRNSGQMSARILSEAQLAVVQYLAPAANVAASFCTVSMIVGLLIWLNPVVALASFALFGGCYGGTYLFSMRITRTEGEVRAVSNAERYQAVNEALGGIKDIKLLGRERPYIHRFEAPSLRATRSAKIASLAETMPQYAMRILAFGGMIVLCLALVDSEGLASGRSLEGLLPLIGVFAFAGQRLMPELQQLYSGLTRLQYGRAAVEAVHNDLALHETEEALPPAPPAPIGLREALTLEHIAYRYPGAESDGLRDVSLSIRAGEKIGVVGTSGAGKTTLADVILGLLRPAGGTIRVDGIEITADNLRAWRRSVGYVPQDIFLTDSSVSENIALGVPRDEIDHDRVVRAARIAHLDTFIREQLPGGYAAPVGERGVRLSGGQRQRLGIARAMYHDADLIVFDEATSALDNLTERDVMSAIDNLPGDKTVLVIAHRLTTVQQCDRILILNSGSVAGFDTWDRLMEMNDTFRKLALA